MFRSFRLGTAFGIPLYLHPSFLLLPLYMLLMSRHEGLTAILFGQAVLLTIFGCVMLHELGHALMARFFGIRTRDITLYPIGGVARLESTGDRPLEEIAIALAGPAVNLVIFVLLAPLVALALLSGFVSGPFEALVSGGTLAGFLISYLTFVCLGNLVLLLFNLLPAFPMDGGRVLRAVLSLGMARLKATEIAAALGLLAALALAVLGVFSGSWGLVIVSLFVGFAGQAELFALRQREARRLRPVPVVEPLGPIVLPRPGGFTGLAWDADRGVWVRWLNGVPLDR